MFLGFLEHGVGCLQDGGHVPIVKVPERSEFFIGKTQITLQRDRLWCSIENALAQQKNMKIFKFWLSISRDICGQNLTTRWH
jgi:hypothetical protein